MNNQKFLEVVSKSFIKFLQTHSRSNEKLKILHGAIARDLEKRLGREYLVHSLGFGKGKEAKMSGRYMDKTVDITIFKKDKDLAGVAVKFVMNNYSQNSNNYFENMLGETANIRANKKKYYQIIVLPEELPYYDNKDTITKWEKITDNNVEKYLKLSKDDEDLFFHTPIKTLMFMIRFPDLEKNKITNKLKYKKYYLSIKNSIKLKLSSKSFIAFGNGIILNDYESFIEKVVHSIKSI
ncbi:MAG: hypothetical protein WC241_01635 [Candidatus Paceibacterota bacterium]|jgi:hypothetical protein